MRHLFAGHEFCISVNAVLTAICAAEGAYILILLGALGWFR